MKSKLEKRLRRASRLLEDAGKVAESDACAVAAHIVKEQLDRAEANMNKHKAIIEKLEGEA